MNERGIIGDWIHAHERDRAGMKIYVDAAEPLGPSRGRQSLSFRPDGTFVEGYPGADDRSAQSSGTYRLDGNKLVLERSNGAQPLTYEVTLAQDGRSLQLKKI